jgi:hypothetical protein
MSLTKNDEGFNLNALAHFNLEGASYMEVPSNTMDTSEPYIILNEYDYDRIYNILSKDKITNGMSNLKSGYLLNRCPVSLDRVKHEIKNKKLKLSNNHLTSDFIITHDNLEFEFHGKTIPNITSLFIKGNAFSAFSYKYNNKAKSLLCSKHDWVVRKANNFGYTKTWYAQVFLVKSKAIEIAYLIDTNVVQDVLNINSILNNSTNLVALDEKLLDLLKGMISSSNTDDLEIAGKIIPTIDQSKNYHFLWALYRTCDTDIRYKFTRNKDVQFWIDNNKYDYKHLYPGEFIEELKKNNDLNSEAFIYLEKVARKEIRITNREIYNFTVSIKPEYLNL